MLAFMPIADEVIKMRDLPGYCSVDSATHVAPESSSLLIVANAMGARIRHIKHTSFDQAVFEASNKAVSLRGLR